VSWRLINIYLLQTLTEFNIWGPEGKTTLMLFPDFTQTLNWPTSSVGKGRRWKHLFLVHYIVYSFKISTGNQCLWYCIQILTSLSVHLTGQPYLKKGRWAKVKDGIRNLIIGNYLIDQYSHLAKVVTLLLLAYYFLYDGILNEASLAATRTFYMFNSFN
jgi:hypothetical protein